MSTVTPSRAIDAAVSPEALATLPEGLLSRPGTSFGSRAVC